METIPPIIFIILAVAGCAVVIIIMLVVGILVVLRRREGGQPQPVVPDGFRVPEVPVTSPATAAIEAESVAPAAEATIGAPLPILRVIVCASCGASQEVADDQAVCAYCGGALMAG